MSTIDELGALVRLIALEVQNNIRTNPANPTQRGWGQFVDAAAHAHQIGTYGTCAALLVLSIGQPEAAIDPNAVQQIRDFWSSGLAGTKLYEQNVRLAFLILSLAKIQNPTLMTVRDAVAQELRARQQQDGSWGDWRSSAANRSPGRAEATAWAVLALARLDRTDPRAIKGADYLVRQLSGAGHLKVLSPMAVAAAVSVLPRDRQTTELRQRALSLVKSMQVDEEECISFFDYMHAGTRMARDYLCFPAFYPLSLLTNGLLRQAGWMEVWPLAAARMGAIDGLTKMIGNSRLYRLPGASFAATVDQAMVALAYEQLKENPPSIDPIVARLRPLVRWASNSVFVRVVLPLIIIVCAIVTLQSPAAVPTAIQELTGAPLGKMIKFAQNNSSVIQLAVAIIIAIFPQLPRSVWTFARRRLRL